MKKQLKIKSFIALLVILALSLNPAYAKIEILDTSISGSIIETGSFSQIDGNENLSFVDEGYSLTNDFIANARKKLKNGWRWDTDIRVRKTDDQQVDTRQDVHLLQLTSKLYNKNYQLTFGDFYTQFTNLTLNRSFEGFNFKADWNKRAGTNLNLIAGRQFRSLERVRNTRYVWGYHVDQKVPQSWISETPFIKDVINDITLGQTVVHTFDSGGSTKFDLGVADLNNFLVGGNIKIRAIDDLRIELELAKSITGDHDDQVIAGDLHGTAFTLKTDYNFDSRMGQSYISFDYDRVKPDFIASSGSFVGDREAFYAGWRQIFNQYWTLNSNLRTLRNNLDDDIITSTRTFNPRFSLDITPFSNMTDFVIRPFYDYRHVKASNSLTDTDTHLTGVEVSKQLIYGINLRGGYDIRKRTDDAGVTDQTVHEYRIGFDHRMKFDQFWLAPYFDMTMRNDRLDDIPNRSTFRDFVWGMRAEFFDRLRVNFNYGINYVDSSFADTDTNRQSWRINAEYDILDNVMLVVSWRQYDQEFQRSISDFEENVGSVRLQFKY